MNHREHEAGHTGGRDALEASLAKLSAPAGGGSGELWKRALESVDAPLSMVEAKGSRADVLHRPLPTWAAWVGVAAVLVLVVGVMLPSLGKARMRVRDAAPMISSASSIPPAGAMSVGNAMPMIASGSGSTAEAEALALLPDDSAGGPMPPSAATAAMAPSAVSAKADWIPTRARAGGNDAAKQSGSAGAYGEPSGVELFDRAVVRRASMNLRVADVRSAFARAQAIISEARGEYIQDAQLNGAAEKAVATIVLRVRSSGLDQTLTELRSLGEVVSESVKAEDVTEQVVDIDARLKNEQRIEKELIELLNKRAGSPLRDVLELRSSINNVRQGIERLTAQRDRLGRLVALSSLTLTIEHESVRFRGSVGEPTLTERFERTMSRAWRWAVETLMESLAFVLAVGVGGALIWLVAGIVGAIVWRKVRRGKRDRAAELAREPAPRLDD